MKGSPPLPYLLDFRLSAHNVTQFIKSTQCIVTVKKNLTIQCFQHSPYVHM